MTRKDGSCESFAGGRCFRFHQGIKRGPNLSAKIVAMTIMASIHKLR